MYLLLSVGVELVKKALVMPITQIVKNTGNSPTEVIDKVLSSESKTLGYNALTSQFVDMFEAGIIDPTKVSCVSHVTWDG